MLTFVQTFSFSFLKPRWRSNLVVSLQKQCLTVSLYKSVNLSQSRSAVAQIQFAVTPADLTQVKIKFRIRIKIRDREADKWSKKICCLPWKFDFSHTLKKWQCFPTTENAYFCIVFKCKCLVVLHLSLIYICRGAAHQSATSLIQPHVKAL